MKGYSIKQLFHDRIGWVGTGYRGWVITYMTFITHVSINTYYSYNIIVHIHARGVLRKILMCG